MTMSHPVVLFDGVCNLCNGAVDFIIRRDRGGIFQFASLQSSIGQKLLEGTAVPTDLSSMVLVENGKVFRQSSAALRIARRLGFPWNLLFGFIIVPPFLRNAVYAFIAANRYRWFGKSESCRLPTPEERSRFLGSEQAEGELHPNAT